MNMNMKDVCQFLQLLAQNNNKPWFEANKQLYLDAYEHFNNFAQKLILGVMKFDNSIENINLKDCTYRIYRDARFSNNKDPYKTHIGAYICREGKKSGYAGYYFHLEAPNSGYYIGNLLACGLHCPESKVLSSVRQEIFDNPKLFVDNIQQAKGFSLDGNEKLKKMPRGFSEDFEYADLLKYKEYTLYNNFDLGLLEDEEKLLKYTLEHFKKCKPFIDQINRAVEYAKEEM